MPMRALRRYYREKVSITERIAIVGGQEVIEYEISNGNLNPYAWNVAQLEFLRELVEEIEYDLKSGNAGFPDL